MDKQRIILLSSLAVTCLNIILNRNLETILLVFIMNMLLDVLIKDKNEKYQITKNDRIIIYITSLLILSFSIYYFKLPQQILPIFIMHIFVVLLLDNNLKK